MKPVLVDTSAWRHFFAGSVAFRPLAELLDEDGAVLMHPFVVGELVLGGLSSEKEKLFGRLPGASVVPHEEVLDLVKRRYLVRRAIGWVDAHLLASTLASSALLWTADKALGGAALDMRIAFRKILS
ncbi:MAG TPA: PIN domain-containing protein, partial [Polyangiaceae bacterium]